MLNNSLDRVIDAIVHVLREEALPALDDGAARANVAGALVLLDLVKRRAQWKAEISESEESCRISAFRKLPALVSGTPFAVTAGEMPLRKNPGTPAESFMAGAGGYNESPDHAVARTDDFTIRMDEYVARLISALDAHGDVAEQQRVRLRRWVMDYCIATVAAGHEKSVASTVGDVTRH